MPAIYGPGCPTKYQSHRTYGTRREGRRFKRHAAAGNVALASFDVPLHVDALDIFQAPGTNVSEWPALVGDNPVQAVVSLKPNFGGTSWQSDGGPAVDCDNIGEWVAPTFGTGSGTAYLAVFTTCESPQTNLSTLMQTCPNVNTSDGLFFGIMWGGRINVAHRIGATINVRTTSATHIGEMCRGVYIDTTRPAATESEIWVNGEMPSSFVNVAGDTTGPFTPNRGAIGDSPPNTGGPWGGIIREMVILTVPMTNYQKVAIQNILNYKARVL